MDKFKILLIGSLALFSLPCFSRILHYGDMKETVTIAYGGPTIFRFDEEVKTISQASKFKIAAADTDNPDYKMLSVTPRFTRGSNDVTFILANGAIVNTRIVVVPKNLPEKTDSFYDFRPKEQLIDRSQFGDKDTGISKIDLMKSMIRQEDVVGYKVKSLSRAVNSGVDGITAKLMRIYSGPKFNGYIFKIVNNTKKNFAIDVRALGLGRINLALLSQVDRKILESKKSGKNSTFLRIVARPSSVYYSVRLPISKIAKK